MLTLELDAVNQVVAVELPGLSGPSSIVAGADTLSTQMRMASSFAQVLRRLSMLAREG